MKNKAMKKGIAVLCGAAMMTGLSVPAMAAEDASDLSNTLVYAGEEVETVNPLLSSHGEVSDIVFSGLMKYDENNLPIPDLAESYEYDDDSLTYTFHLRDGIKWQDGEDFSVDDVVFTYDVLRNDETLASTITTNYEDIETVEAPDDSTVVFTLSEYNAAMLDYFTLGIVPKHLLEGEDINTTSFNQNPIGTGRYKMTEWDTAGGMIILEKNEDYYDKVPNIDRIIYKTVADETTKATMIQSGEADLAWLNANYAEAFRNDDNFTNWDYVTADYRAMAMDMATDFWKENADSIGVLNYALDKDAIVAGVLNGRGWKAYSPIQLSNMGGNEAADIYPYDLEKFDEEMTALGWEKGDDGIYERNGEKFHFTIQVREYEEERVDIANLCANMLKAAGVDMEVVLVTKFDWQAGYNGFLYGNASQFDADQLYSEFVTGASNNTMSYSNAEVDELLKAARHEKDPEARKADYAEFEEVYAENPGIVLTCYLEGNYVGIKGLEGLNTTRVLGHHAVGVFWNIEDWTLTR